MILYHPWHNNIDIINNIEYYVSGLLIKKRSQEGTGNIFFTFKYLK